MNWEELGFRSQQELDESIKRVKADPKNDLELRAENRAKFESINKNGGVDFNALNEGMRLSELDRVVASKLYWEREAEKQRAEQEAIQDIMSGLSEQVEVESQEKAQREFNKQKEKADEELQKEIYTKHNVKTDHQKERDEAYKGMLKGLNI